MKDVCKDACKDGIARVHGIGRVNASHSRGNDMSPRHSAGDIATKNTTQERQQTPNCKVQQLFKMD